MHDPGPSGFGLGFRVRSLGFKVWGGSGLGCKAWGLEFGMYMVQASIAFIQGLRLII